ncbi:NAD(P)H-hydrate dehydratase [Massilia phyllosphaerae]|uniref:NAD(P)H-hydrate dehydratase n=1 Tax=Massilia phyllosphaerae TaxID=3106034 RepID=UPI002B1CE207|nr:NAD(P)H-hydrate dehydratase [Massilia sp. SGZ-792]
MDTQLYSVAQIRAIEQAAQAGLPPGTLMRRAGAASAARALDLLKGRPVADLSLPVMVLAGPGNNGGDALEAAVHLSEAGWTVEVVHLAGSTPSPETQAALERARGAGLRFIDAVAADAQYALVVDGLFGIGLTRPLTGQARQLAEQVNIMRGPVLALDVPSGLDADTGAIVGPGGVAVAATHTITFLGDKPGLHTGDGCDYAGRVSVDLLDVAVREAAQVRCNTPALFGACLAPRRRNSHKGSFGDVAVLGGAPGMLGAGLLAARGALFAGAGRVFLVALDAALGVDPLQPEIMLRDAAGFAFERRTVVAGPGLGDSSQAMRLLGKVIDGSGPLLLDADGLNLVAASPDLQARLAHHDGPVVLTPHPLEAARLLGVTAAIVQADRLENARELAQRLNAVVVLKGAGSVIARQDGEVAINPTGNPGLATGGSGDVLAGVCGALLGQGWPAWEAALGAVWLHGAAADRLVADGAGPIGLTAGELPRAIRAERNRLVAATPAAGGRTGETE